MDDETDDKKRKGNPSTNSPLIRRTKKRKVRLMWSRDPETRSFLSDYLIEILVNATTHGRYRVHRAKLVAGNKGCDYFVTLFRNECFEEAKTNTSRIELQPLAADAFPVFLDYLYSEDDELISCTPENAVALRHLGEYFDMESLSSNALRFCATDMKNTSDNFGMYYEHAKIFNDEYILKTLVKRCCSVDLPIIAINSGLVLVSDAQFWLATLKENDGKPNVRLACLIADFCVINKDDLDADTFFQLMDESALPELPPLTGVFLMEIEKGFLSTSSNNLEELTSLQNRAIEALVKVWRQLNLADNIVVAIMKRSTAVNPLVASELLRRTLENAQKEVLRLEDQRARLLPQEIIVTNAGTAALSGVYAVSAEYHNDAPRFVRPGRWNDSPVTFALQLDLVQYSVGGERRSERRWHLRTEGSVNLFYVAELRQQNNLLPPQDGWFSNSGHSYQGAAPFPALSYRFTDG